MNLRVCVSVALLLILTACRLAGGAAPSPSVSQSSAESPVASGSAPHGGGVSEQEAIEIASSFRNDPDTTVFTAATSGSFAEVAPTMTNDHIAPDQRIWAVSFAGDYDVGCEYSDCPKAGTETVILDFLTGQVLMAQIYSPEE